LPTQRHLKDAVFDANLSRESQAACLAHKGIQLKHMHMQPRIAAQQYGDKNKFYQLLPNSKICFTILIYFYHHIVPLRCMAARACVSTGFLREPNKPLGTRELKFASKTAFLRCL